MTQEVQIIFSSVTNSSFALHHWYRQLYDCPGLWHGWAMGHIACVGEGPNRQGRTSKMIQEPV
jgi:hypothetical protein